MSIDDNVGEIFVYRVSVDRGTYGKEKYKDVITRYVILPRSGLNKIVKGNCGYSDWLNSPEHFSTTSNDSFNGILLSDLYSTLAIISRDGRNPKLASELPNDMPTELTLTTEKGRAYLLKREQIKGYEMAQLKNEFPRVLQIVKDHREHGIIT